MHLCNYLQLNEIIATSQGSNALGESPEILRMAVKLIGNDHLSVASAAVQFLSDCGRASPSMAQMLLGENQDSNLPQLKSVILKSDEVRYRVFEVNIFNIYGLPCQRLSLSNHKVMLS